MTSHRLDGQSIIVTGAAQGIGLGIARRFANEGASVVIGDLNGDGADSAAASIEDDGGKALGVQVDVTDRTAVRHLIETTVEHFGSLNVMFNNAGFNKPMPFLEVTKDNWDAVMSVNAWGVLVGTQEAARQMIRQDSGGKIVNTASIASRQGYPSFLPYCASKFAVVAITQAGARALAKDGITVNAFAPGVVDTPLWTQLDQDLMDIGDAEEPGQAFEEFASGILQGRAATPDDIAGTAVYLASADSDYMTGQVVMIDGGMVLV